MNESTYPTVKGSVKEPLSSITLPVEGTGAISNSLTVTLLTALVTP